jgi:hypothetical protein
MAKEGYSMISGETIARYALAFWATFLLQADFASAKCETLQGSGPVKLLEYLRGERSALNQECVLFAIADLGMKRYAPASATLVKYLDYKLPQEPSKTGPVVVKRIWWIGADYPAAAALFKIGKPSSPALVEAVGDPDNSDLIRKHAIEVLRAVHSDNMADVVAALVRAGRSSEDHLTSRRLLDAAEEVATSCHEPQRNSCINALSQ